MTTLHFLLTWLIDMQPWVSNPNRWYYPNSKETLWPLYISTIMTISKEVLNERTVNLVQEDERFKGGTEVTRPLTTPSTPTPVTMKFDQKNPLSTSGCLKITRKWSICSSFSLCFYLHFKLKTLFVWPQFFQLKPTVISLMSDSLFFYIGCQVLWDVFLTKQNNFLPLTYLIFDSVF